MNTNMEKKQYCTPLVQTIQWTTEEILKVGGTGSPDLPPGPGVGLAPARHLGGSKSEVF